jgi:uncharacterized Zn-finger protein
MANDTGIYMIADGLPMNLEQMHHYLQEHFGVPLALRLKGTTSIVCPYCSKGHVHAPLPGHHAAVGGMKFTNTRKVMVLTG